MGLGKRWAVLCLGFGLGGCGAPPPPPTEAYWGQRQVLFRLEASGARLEVLGLRGGITPLGQLALPPDFQGKRLVLDGEREVLLVVGAAGWLEVDARSLAPLHRWSAPTASAPEGMPLGGSPLQR